MIDRKRVINYLIKQRNEQVKIGPYWIPKRVWGIRNGGQYFNIPNYRDSVLNEMSEYEQNFYNTIKDSGEDFIREFPIPILDRETWIEICNNNLIKEDLIINKTILSLDFFMFKRGFVIEIDGAQHWENQLQKASDIIRDNYLERKYGIKTYRFPQFSYTTYTQGKLYEIGNSNPVLSNPFPLKQLEDDWINYWIEFNKEILSMIEVLENKYKSQNKISLTTKQITKLGLSSILFMDKEYFKQVFQLFTQKQLLIK